MESSAFWRDLRREFQDLSVGVPQGQSLYAIDHDDGTWAVGGGPDDEMERAALRRRFRALAERAAAAAGLPLAGDLQDSWLTLLKSGPRYAPMELCQTGDTGSRSLDTGWIEHLPTDSADFCTTLETQAFLPSPPPRPEAALVEQRTAVEAQAAARPFLVSEFDLDSADGRREATEAFLEASTTLATRRLTKRDIWITLRYSSPRQFEYWQAAAPSATRRITERMRRIFDMTPAEFAALAEKTAAQDKG